MNPSKFAIGSPEWPGLSKLAEEAGEVLQVVGKLMGTGGKTNHWDGTNLADRLSEELADLMAACDFVITETSGLDAEAIRLRRERKLATFREWHAAQTVVE